MENERSLRAVGAAAAEDAGGVEPDLLGDFLATITVAAAAGRRLRRRELEACSAEGRRAATAGVALRALVDLYLSAAWRLWRDVPEVSQGDADRVRAAALSMLRATDDGVAALAEGFQLARADLSRLHEAARHDVLEALLAGGRRAIDAAVPAMELGLVVSGPLAVVVARRPGGFTGPSHAALPGRVERTLQGRHGDAQPLVLTRSGELICVFAAPDPAAVSEVRAAVATALDARLGGDDAWRGAVSSRRTGPSGVATSYEEARYAVELADRLGLGEAVVDAADLAVYRVLLRDRPAVDDLVATTLTPLTTARGGAAPLLETLEAFYGSGGVATLTAARLQLSVRAVTYRMARIADLLGRDPADPAERFTLQAAVTAARLLDWPRTPLTSGG